MSEFGIELARPWGLALLLLALPWIRWAQRRAPLAWPVGGLEPFRALAGKARRRRGWPLSLWLGLSALLTASLAASGPRQPESRSLWLVDGSFSYAAHPEAAAPDWQPPADADRRRVGELGVASAPELLLDAARLDGAGRRVVVLTDQPAPEGLPASVEWRRRPSSGRNAAILDCWPEGEGLLLRWGRWGGGGALSLAAGDQDWELRGDGGLLRLPSLPAGTELLLRAGSGRPWVDDQPQDDRWRLPEAVLFLLPAEADERWEAALQAAWPGCRWQRGPEPAAEEVGGMGGTRFRIRFDGAGVFGFAADPFQQESELDAVALIGDRLASAYQDWHPARPWQECAPPGPAPAWPGGPEAPVRWRDASRALAAVGLLLYLASLLARRLES